MSNETTKRTLTDKETASAMSALALLLPLISAAEMGQGASPTSLPSDITTCTAEQQDEILVRTVYALRHKREESARNVMIAAKKGVDTAMHVARLARIEAFREIASLSPTVVALLGDKANPPTSTSIPVSDVVSFFPEGMSESQIIATLHKMNYKLTPGAKKDDIKRLFVTINADQIKAVLASDKSDVQG